MKKCAVCHPTNVLGGSTPVNHGHLTTSLTPESERKPNFKTASLNFAFLEGLMIPLTAFLASGYSVCLFDTPEDGGSPGLAFALQGLMADSQINSLFFCHLNKECFRLIRAPTHGNMLHLAR